jgi:type II secretory pathway predicted ATPase ExeA
MHEFDERERDYMLTVLLAAHTQLLHELHHADSTEYKQQLRSRIELNEMVTLKVQGRVGVVV